MRSELLKMVWKLLRPIIEDALKDLLKLAVDRITKFVTDLQRERAEQAKQKADAAAAASKANADSDPIEAARQAGKEEAWREIAEHYKRDIEALRGELAQVRAALQSSGNARLNEVEAHEIPRLASDSK
ncbi:hypothetical protein AWB81_07432 [Caballeronia arationis]|uniref:hypothetical protein n=1 Tax=Caballeronia arationis TaxID=1777142 RepID=UPI00074C9039|nr:hypothetical protein [Caballeronia arationis]SAL06076.1 hypothetical protein AWB81_07432 [Caballeronia arationis]